MANAILAVVLLVLLLVLAAFYRYSRTEDFRRGDLRRAGLGFLMIIGPFFGVHPRRVEPEPTTISTPKDDVDDPLADRARISTPEPTDPGEQRRPPVV